MASPYFSPFKERKRSAPKGPATNVAGHPGAEAAGGALTEKTASWPEAGPSGPMPFNKRLKWPVVKTTAKKHGLS